MSYLHGKFVWFEHVSNDIAKARTFYGALFGWHSDAVPMGEQPYHLIKNGEQAIGGFRSAPPGVQSHWLSYLSVPDVDASFKAATAAGAKGLMPPTDFPPAGRGAALADPTGAAFAIWKGATEDRPDAEKTAAGDWFWNECWTPDDKKALGFYESVFGFAHEAMDMGPQGTYYVLKMDDKPRAGLMKSTEAKAPPLWLPYVAVADCDASAEKAKSLGAQVVVPPTDIPEVGRFAVLMDPAGAALAVIRSARS